MSPKAQALDHAFSSCWCCEVVEPVVGPCWWSRPLEVGFQCDTQPLVPPSPFDFNLPLCQLLPVGPFPPWQTETWLNQEHK